MTALFSQVAEVFSRRQAKKTEDRETLVNAILDGGKKAPTPAQIATALDEMGWDPEGLEKEVARRQQRRQDAAALAEVPALEKEKAELERKGAAEVARYEALIAPLRQEHQRNIGTLNGRFHFVAARIPEALEMRNKLLQSYRGPLTTELDDNRAKQAELQREIQTAIRQAERHEHAATFTRSQEPSFVQQVSQAGQFVGVVAESLGWDKVKDLESVSLLPPDERKAAEAAAKSCREEAAKLQKQVDAMVRREAEILELMLEP
jgi:hypothetical protein